MYRQTRNIEASFIDFLTTNFNSDWGNITVEKTFARVYEIPMNEQQKTAIVCLRVGTSAHDKVEIGSNATKREVQVLIDIFATGDGQRLDIKDYIISKIKNGMIYYEYTIANGAVSVKTANGRIAVLAIEDAPINFDVDKNALDVHDRYRSLITLTINISQVEE